MIEYKMFLDDIRYPSDIHYDTINTDPWFIVRDFYTATEIIESIGCPHHISFDHDLGTDLTGYDLAKWLVEKSLDNDFFLHEEFTYAVHSANPIGSKNIGCLFENYFRVQAERELEQEKIAESW